MTYQHNHPFKQSLPISLRFLLVGLFILGVVFFLPNARYHDMKTILSVAQASQWQNPGDWPAAWSSLRIFLLGLGGFLIWASVGELLIAFKRETLVKLLSILLVAPIWGCWLGLYYLLKSVF
jgi:hypothetical protein